MAESGRSLPREPLSGSLHREFKACGTAGCRCHSGALHGPYWRRFWWEDGKLHTAYVRRDDVEGVRAAIADWRDLHPPVRSMRDQLARLRRMSMEVLSGKD